MNKKMVMIAALVLLAVLAGTLVFWLRGEKQEDVANPAVVSTPTEEPVIVTEETEAPQDQTADQAQAAAMTDEDAEVEIEVVELFGVIAEITEEYVMIDTVEHGQVQANLSDDTMIEGVEALEIGQTARVLYDGRMTRSLPPQIHALLIGVYAVTGEVKETAEGSVTIVSAQDNQEIVLTLPEGAEAIAVGDVITAYTTGMSTMSLPPQMNAVTIVK